MTAKLCIMFTVLNLGLVFCSLCLWFRTHSIGFLLLVAVLAGMIYDNLVIWVGHLAQEGIMLKFLHRLRFVLHNLLVPLLGVAAVQLAQEVGMEWAMLPVVNYGSWAIALILIGFGFGSNFADLELIPISFAGILHYRAKRASPCMPLFTTLLVAIVGGSLWSLMQWPWMFVGTLSIVLGNAIPATLVGPLLSAAAETCLLLSMLVTELHFF